MNFLGPFLLTEFLARRRERDGAQLPCSVINVASGQEAQSQLDKAEGIHLSILRL